MYGLAVGHEHLADAEGADAAVLLRREAVAVELQEVELVRVDDLREVGVVGGLLELLGAEQVELDVAVVRDRGGVPRRLDLRARVDLRGGETGGQSRIERNGELGSGTCV